MTAVPSKRELNLCLNRLASYRGVVLSCRSLAVMLIVSFLVLAFGSGKTLAPLYIVLTLGLLPPFLSSVISASKRYQNKYGDELSKPLFPLLQRKYNFSELRFLSLNLTYIIILLLLLTWRIHYILFPSTSVFLCYLPVFIIGISLLLRILCTVGYLIYFRLFPLHAIR